MRPPTPIAPPSERSGSSTTALSEPSQATPAGDAGAIVAAPKKPPEFTLAALRESIEAGYVVAEYQPKVPFDPDRDSWAVEVLCRLYHPRFGQVYPDTFIGLAEKNGLIGALTDAIVRQAFADWRKWFEHGLTLTLAINVSPDLLDSSAWTDRFLAMCEEFEIAAEYITLEITESSSKAASDSAVDVLSRLKLKGVTLSIDDFGTGFSSLATLYRLPFSELKIDKTFVLQLDRDPAARALIESTVEMAQRLGLKVTAEGVETDSTFAQLRLIGCDEAQGYFISKSLPAADIPGFFAEWKKTRASQADGNPGFVPKLAAIQSLLNDVTQPGSENQTLMLSATRWLREDASIPEVVAAIPPLVLQERFVAALAACHRAVDILKTVNIHAALKRHILELQRLVEYRLLETESLLLEHNGARIHLRPRRSALIGRHSDGNTAHVAINCRWLSRGERNLYVYFDHGEWLIEDQGSTNGAHVAGAQLVPGSPVVLTARRTSVQIGRPDGQEAPLSLLIERPNGKAETISVGVIAGTESDPMNWPSREDDLRSKWIFSREDICVGTASSCAIRIHDCAQAVLADVRFQNGYWIAPRPGVPLSVDGISFEHPAPLTDSTTIKLGNNTFVVQGRKRASGPSSEKRERPTRFARGAA